MTSLTALLSSSTTTTIAISGLAKNTGKTTTLNACINTFPSSTAIGLTSIGLDGEDIDQVTFLPKPSITVRTGMTIATAEETLKKTAIKYDVITRTPFSTALGDILIIKVTHPGTLVIAGPSTNKELNACVNLLKTHSDKVFIDGAFNRKTFANIDALDGLILATGASCHPIMEETIKQTKAIVESFTYPKTHYDVEAIHDTSHPIYAPKKSSNGRAKRIGYRLPKTHNYKTKTLYIRGAITPSIIDYFIAQGDKNTTLIIDDATKLLLPNPYFTYIKKLHMHIEVLHPISLLFVTINPFSPKGHDYDKDSFYTAMQDSIDIPVINVQEKE